MAALRNSRRQVAGGYEICINEAGEGPADIAAAETASIVVARSRVGDGAWHRTLLFIVPDFASSSIRRIPGSPSDVSAQSKVFLRRSSVGACIPSV